MLPVWTLSALALALCARLSLAADFDACGGPQSTDFFAETDAVESGAPSAQFCADWNPQFRSNGGRCCHRLPPRRDRRGRRTRRCDLTRYRGSFCADQTSEQFRQVAEARAGKAGDHLKSLEERLRTEDKQAYCSVNNGFLARGVPTLELPGNRIRVLSPERCTFYGTARMATLLEALGRQIADRYPEDLFRGAELLVGDIASPRGGCLGGPSGRRSHASHTSGLDADLGFLTPKSGRAPTHFGRDFDAEANWWFLKALFTNPYACVRVVFLDRRLIRKLANHARKSRDGETWARLGRFIRHSPGHRNHHHVRIGETSGPPGCSANPHPEDETEEDIESSDALGEGDAPTDGLDGMPGDLLRAVPAPRLPEVSGEAIPPSTRPRASGSGPDAG